jgi:pimeloyl-ACP methyl ester carboxylesterase
MSVTGAPLRRVAEDGMVYDRHGAGRTVVLVHGWALSGRLWIYQEELFGGAYDVVVPDLPGFGRSAGLAGPYDLERHTASLRALLQEIDAENAVLVGFAYGAAVSLLAAAADPSRIAGLALIGTPQSGQLPVEKMVRSMRRDWPGYARRSAEALCPGLSDATVRWLESIFLATRLSVAIETWTSISAFDPLSLVSSVDRPMLFLHGEQDDFSPLTVARDCAAAARDATVEVAPETRHLVPVEQPAWLDSKLQAFLTEVS